MRLEDAVSVLASLETMQKYFEDKARQFKETGASVELWGPFHREQGFYCYLVLTGAKDSLRAGRILATQTLHGMRVAFYLEEFPDEGLFWGLADSLIAEIRQLFQTVSDEQAAPQAGTGKKKFGPTARTQERAKVFKRLKELHPEWSQAKVAMEACDELGEFVTEDTVRNTYRAMGWKWERADRIR